MKNIILLVSLLFSASVLADAGFTAGDEFEAHYVEGNLNLTCYGPQGQVRRVYWRCFDSYLTPAMYTKFYTDSGVDADNVKITSTNAKGNSRSKSSRFSTKKGQSKSTFNLWINTLFQRALLGYGTNTISYELSKDGDEVESGEFEVDVIQQPAKYCQSAWYTSYNMNDCVNGNFVCGQYLRQYAHTCR
jgi:hypothetical protein